jgi:SUN domain-containing protein 1/2
MSIDNKAYKPSASDVEEDDYGSSDDGKGKKKKKKKKKDAVGLVNTLPSLTYDKRKKKRGKGGKGALAEAEESDGEGSESDDQTTDKVMRISPFLFIPFSLPPHPSSNPHIWIRQ